MTYRLTSAQRCVLADCTRAALVGWLLTDPAVDRSARRIEYKATGILGFGFSRFVTMAMNEFGPGYRPGSVLSGDSLPTEHCGSRRSRQRYRVGDGDR